MTDRFKYLLNQLGERLWVKPLGMTVIAVVVVFLARISDQTGLQEFVPDITSESINTLLSVMSASMLVIATFSVASMVSAYSSASAVATPRAFPLIISDDVSQNALSVFIGAFIFSVVALTATENSYFDKAGRFTLFCLTILFFTVVILTFVRWVDRIARLGRLEETVTRVELATAEALERRHLEPRLGGRKLDSNDTRGESIFTSEIGYVQQIEMKSLQAIAEAEDFQIAIHALPGVFVARDIPVARIIGNTAHVNPRVSGEIADAFFVGKGRTYTNDPRFGLVVLSEIASRALSPAVNDPGTAIDVIGRFVRLLSSWSDPPVDGERSGIKYDRIAVPELAIESVVEDAFNAIGRDGAGLVEVAIHLQHALRSLSSTDSSAMKQAARQMSERALQRSLDVLTDPQDIDAVNGAAAFADST